MIDEYLVPGTLIADRYRIGTMLGEGSMGAVYQGEHVRVGRAVAVKVLSRRWGGQPEVARRFRDEARAASAAGHPNIIDVFDAGELPDGRPYLVMEHLSGRELYDVIIERGCLEVERACRILCDVARALEAAHAAGIIHRDLKTENVMLVRRGGQEIVKVLDFGIAANTMGARATMAGQVMGTPATMAPEQTQGAQATTAFDVYALGVMLHEAIAGITPFGGRDGLDLMAVKVNEPAPSIATVVDDLPADLVALIDACLAREPEGRPSVSEVAERLDAIGRRRPAAGPGMVALDMATTSSRSPRWIVPVAVTAVVLLAGVGAWALFGAGHEVTPVAEARPVDAAPVDVTPTRTKPPDEPPPVVVSPPPEERTRQPRPTSDGAPTPDPSPKLAPAPAEPAPSEPAPAEEATPSDDASASHRSLCWRTRKQAQQAREAHDWSGVLRHTREGSCWSEQRAERGRLRTKAFMELGRWSDCIGASRGLGDEQVETWRRVCERRQEQP
ncbi:serine/threonine-protein kinase [Paraliomyxa miuraensis]|uniref:serine/threonine-protein kinase n=1 Tax=Paraliomyxa miuraensis TaxID=376150 RepID=UPI0022587FCA|nr:serine/threonine-protein kinase [Paraliomyxa miuraensis]MCX4246950.1 serine/threonine protein kinase [Paraliomyxa miuraensis]